MTYGSIVRPLFIAVALAILMAAMRFASPIVVPVMLAAFFSAILYPIYQWLLGKRVPAVLALLATCAVLVVVALFLVALVSLSFEVLISSLASYSSMLSQRQAEFQALTENLNISSSPLRTILAKLNPTALMNVMGFIISTIISIGKQSLFILLVTIFFLAEGGQFASRMWAAFGKDHPFPQKATAMVGVFIHYFGLRTVVNLITGTGIAICLWLLGIDHALLWGVLTFFMSYIPYLGIMIALTPPVILGYAEYGLGMAVLIIILAIVVNGLAENVVAPLIMGKGLKVSPTVVFLSFIFWMWLMGSTAALIAMPLTVAVLMLLSSFDETHPWAAMAGTIPEPPASVTAPS